MLHDPADLDAGATLHQLEGAARRRRRAEVDDLLLVLHWADLHSADPRDNRDGFPRPPGSEQLVSLAGDGAPGVQELALCELGVARGVHTLSARAVTADALDLRHRLPHIWERVLDLGAEVWIARKVASMSRHLSAEAVRLVDEAVADAIGTQSPARVLELTEAKVVEADRPTHEVRVAQEMSKRYVGLGRIDEHGLRTVIARVTAGDAQWIDATVTRVAEILGTRPEHEHTPLDELRSLALGWLARPVELLTLLLEHGDQGESRATAFPADLLDALRDLDPALLRPRGTLYVHLHEAVLESGVGVARVEGLGPHTLSALRDLLATAEVKVTPVLDLADRISTAAYEHPEAIKERIHLLRPGDQFPYATSMSRRCDLDHPVPYDHHVSGAPPGQTCSHDSQPLTRSAHRAKTHLGYRCTSLPGGEILSWVNRLSALGLALSAR